MTRFLLLVVVPALAVLAGGYWYAVSGRWISTENAYVKSNIIAVSPTIDGRVTEVVVADNQLVRKGEVLFTLNPAPHRITLAHAEAKVQAVRNEIEATRAEFRQVEAEIEEAKERVKFAEAQARRARELQNRGVAAMSRLDEAELELATARQNVRALREKVKTVLAKLGGDPTRAAELHPRYQEAEADRDMAALRLSYTTIRAPADGIVSRMQLQPGEWVEEGKAVFTLIETQNAWVEANFKETQLTHLQAGQEVRITVDAYPGVEWRAVVASLSPATGSEFSLLPPQNASGNWVKVVQRLPVRIDLLDVDGRPPLRAGMTATVEVDTRIERTLAAFARQAIASVRGE